MGITIVNKTGIANDTKVHGDDGSEITGITNIKIEEIRPGGMIRAHLSFEFVKLDIESQLDDNLRAVSVPLGSWNSVGYWFPNRLLKMSTREQYDVNIRGGHEMKLTGFVKAEVGFDHE